MRKVHVKVTLDVFVVAADDTVNIVELVKGINFSAANNECEEIDFDATVIDAIVTDSR